MSNDTYHVFTHKDLDGAVSLLTFIWSHPDTSIFFNELTNLETSKIKDFVNKTINCKNIYVFDLALREEFLPTLDTSCVTFVDHHERSIPHIQSFKNAKILHKVYSSNSLLIKKLFVDFNKIELSDKQKKLIVLTDDFDSEKCEFEESLDLNILFWTKYKNNFSGFIEFFKNGYVKPTQEEQKHINFEKLNAKKQSENLQKYIGTLNIKGVSKNVIGIQMNSSNYLVKRNILKNNDADLYFFINPKLN